VKDRYFRPTSQPGQFEIRPEIKRMVRFATLNLVEDVYPSPINETNAMDVIFCRNVLMYFTAPQAIKVMRKLYRAQADGGWLFVQSQRIAHGSSSLYRTVIIRARHFIRRTTPNRVRKIIGLLIYRLISRWKIPSFQAYRRRRMFSRRRLALGRIVRPREFIRLQTCMTPPRHFIRRGVTRKQ